MDWCLSVRCVRVRVCINAAECLDVCSRRQLRRTICATHHTRCFPSVNLSAASKMHVTHSPQMEYAERHFLSIDKVYIFRPIFCELRTVSMSRSLTTLDAPLLDARHSNTYFSSNFSPLREKMRRARVFAYLFAVAFGPRIMNTIIRTQNGAIRFNYVDQISFLCHFRQADNAWPQLIRFTKYICHSIRVARRKMPTPRHDKFVSTVGEWCVCVWRVLGLFAHHCSFGVGVNCIKCARNGWHDEIKRSLRTTTNKSEKCWNGEKERHFSEHKRQLFSVSANILCSVK